jgi:hypothetical protein
MAKKQVLVSQSKLNRLDNRSSRLSDKVEKKIVQAINKKGYAENVPNRSLYNRWDRSLKNNYDAIEKNEKIKEQKNPGMPKMIEHLPGEKIPGPPVFKTYSKKEWKNKNK